MRALLILFFVLSFLACAETGPESATNEEAVAKQSTIADVIAEHGTRLVAIPGVTMIYEGATEEGQPCIKLGVVELTDDLKATLPTTLGGWAVIIEETGEIRPLGDS